MREIIFLVLLALLFIAGEARPKDDVVVQPTPRAALAVSNGTDIKTPKTLGRFVADGYGKRSVPDEGDPEGSLESEVKEGPPGGDTAVKETEEGNYEEKEEGEEKEGKEEKESAGVATESAKETDTKITFSRDRRSPQRNDGSDEIDNDKSSEDTSDNTTIAVPIARPPRPGFHRASEAGATENVRIPEKEAKEPTEATTASVDDTKTKTTFPRAKRSPQLKNGTCEENNGTRSKEDTSDDTTIVIPIARPLRPGSHRAAEEGTSRKGETSETEGIEKIEKKSTDETTDSTEDTSSSRSKRSPQSKDGTGDVDNDKSSEEDTYDETPAVASSAIATAQKPRLQRPTEGNVAETRVTAGNDEKVGKQDKESGEDTTGSSEETNTKTSSSRNKRSPQEKDGNDKSSKDTKDNTTAAPTIIRTPRPGPRRTTVSGVTGKAITPARHAPTPTPTTKVPIPNHTARKPTPTPTTKTPSH